MSARTGILWILLASAAPVLCSAQATDSNSNSPDAMKQSLGQVDDMKKSVKEDLADEKSGIGSAKKQLGELEKNEDPQAGIKKQPGDSESDNFPNMDGNSGPGTNRSASASPTGGFGAAGRGPSYYPQAAASAPPAADPQVQAQQAQREQRTTRRAQAMASALRSSLNPFEGAPGGAPASSPGSAVSPDRSGTARQPGQAAGPSPSNPRSKADLLLASVAGFGGAFKDLGMRAEKGPAGEALIFNKAGAPATDQEVSALSARIQSEPEALMRRPDFFDVLQRERFNDLKDDYRSRPDLRQTAFKDIELSPPERDFLRSASCERMSGDCNKFTTQMSYRKGETVPPEDLNNIWGAIKAAVKEDDDQFGAGEFDKDDDAKASEAKRKGDFARRMLFGGRFNLGAAKRRLEAFLGPMGGLLGAGEGTAASAPSAEPFRQGLERDWGPRQAVPFTTKTARRHGALPPQAAPPAPTRRTASLLWLLLAASAGAAIFAGARRLKNLAT